MISEPELVDDGDPSPRPSAFRPDVPGPRGPAGPGESAPEPLFPDDEEKPPRERPPLRAWLWGLGGAAAASALWAGGLYAYEVYGNHDPDTGTYRTSRNLCLDAELKSLRAAYGKVQTPQSDVYEDRALERAVCSVSFLRSGSAPAGNPEASAFVRYTLHKKTDPGPEFTANAASENMYGGEDSTVTRLDGLGERAYVVISYGVPTFHVLDGQAVLTVVFDPGDAGNGEASRAAGAAETRSHVIEDMRALMKKLKS
ncbi:hypothetical protein ACFYT4_23545 [Streptomyces sp. NPDC004609]|uniref:hypothetical protein n=1 Tax=Streptomyces sp. NPDC004609 TaxID=3364704 RepID=UPI003682CEBD